jgi:hypothetical protein
MVKQRNEQVWNLERELIQIGRDAGGCVLGIFQCLDERHRRGLVGDASEQRQACADDFSVVIIERLAKQRDEVRMLARRKQLHRGDSPPIVFWRGGRRREHLQRIAADASNCRIGNDPVEYWTAGAPDRQRQHDVAGQRRKHRDHRRPETFFIRLGNVYARQRSPASLERQRPATVPQAIQ